ncbi:YeeE/YedE family protein [Vagococcus humatus]|uniref:YeeE/YedE family protein n=2 Tax=Vagococcus humatus TaxID=1889241 RepID=A0A3R9YYF9_9ENTE|nr:YeeE/YedE family protein [Vagococcus humatus]
MLNMKKNFEQMGLNSQQPIIGVILIAILAWAGYALGQTKASLPMYLLAGVLLGYILTRSRFGFAGGVKRIYVRGEGSLTKALILMLAVTMFLALGIQWFAASNGAVTAMVAKEGEAIIPGTQNVAFTNIATILGGFIFGVGMMLAGGCASGTLADFGEGEGHAIIALPFFVLGAAPGHWLRYVIDESSVGKVGFQVYLPDYVGFVGAVVITLVLLGVLYWITRRYEDKRKQAGTYADPKSDYEVFEQPLKDAQAFKWTSFETYHKFFIERWSFVTGAILLSVVSIFILITTQKAWGVTSAFTVLDVYVLQKLGMTFESPAFESILEKVNAGLLQDGGTIRNIGLVFGSLIAFLLAGRFKFNFRFKGKDGVYFAVGGLMMGVGSRMAKGCNIGALYSAITNFSLSGWVFLIALTLGGIVGLKAFAGKVCIIPNKK